MLAVLMLAVLGLGFAACSSSDDDEGDGTGVVGVWDNGVDEMKEEKVVATFKGNGTGFFEYSCYEPGEGIVYEKENFTYVKDSDLTGTIIVKYSDDDSSGGGNSGPATYTLTYTIVDNEMIVKTSWGSTWEILKRK